MTTLTKTRTVKLSGRSVPVFKIHDVEVVPHPDPLTGKIEYVGIPGAKMLRMKSAALDCGPEGEAVLEEKFWNPEMPFVAQDVPTQLKHLHMLFHAVVNRFFQKE